MADFTLPYESCRRIMARPVLVSEFEDLTEQRRQTADKDIIGFELTSPLLNDSQAQAYVNHWSGQGGPLTSFGFAYRGTAYTVRYDGELAETHERGLLRYTFRFKVVS